MGTKEKVKKGELTIAQALTMVPEDCKTHRWLMNRINSKPAASKVQGKSKPKKEKRSKKQIKKDTEADRFEWILNQGR